MGFGDIEFGWRSSTFSLTNVKVTSGIELLVLNEDDDWIQREAIGFGLFCDSKEELMKEIDDFEDIRDVKYSKPQRTLSAKLTIIESMFMSMFLGVPDNKTNEDKSKALKINQVDFQIHEMPAENKLKNYVTRGVVAYYEYDDEIKGLEKNHYIELYAPTPVFDDIEKMVNQSDISSLIVSLNIKGWSWLGPIGDTEIYFDKEKRYPVEFGGITVNRLITTNRKDDIELYDEPEDIDEFIEDKPTDFIPHIYNKLADIGLAINSVKIAAWITGFSMLAIAIKLWF